MTPAPQQAPKEQPHEITDEQLEILRVSGNTERRETVYWQVKATRSRQHLAPARRYDSSIYFIGELEIDAGANAISNMFKTGGLNEDQVAELNVALEQFRTASNHPINPAEVARQAREDFLEQIEDKLPRYPSELGDMYLLSDIQELQNTQHPGQEE